MTCIQHIEKKTRTQDMLVTIFYGKTLYKNIFYEFSFICYRN